MATLGPSGRPLTGQGLGAGNPDYATMAGTGRLQAPAQVPVRQVFPVNAQKKPDWLHPDLRIAIVGAIGVLMAICLPLLTVTVLLADANYRFWIDPFYPFAIVCILICVTVVLFVTMHMLFKYAPASSRTEDTSYLVITSFTSLTGLLLVMVALPWGAQMHFTANNLLNGCATYNPKAQKLNYFNQVLRTMRQEPDCFNAASVTSCQGWKATPETEYLQVMEKEFQCAPLCYEERFDPPGPGRDTTALLQHGSMPASASGLLQRGRRAASSSAASLKRGKEGQVPANQTSIYDFLFQKGVSTSMISCYELVAARMKVYAIEFVDLIFWEGFGLVCVGVFVSLFRAMAWCIAGGKDQRYM